MERVYAELDALEDIEIPESETEVLIVPTIPSHYKDLLTELYYCRW